MTLEAGQYYPRMGFGDWPQHSTTHHAALMSFQTQLRLLAEELLEIFETVQPTDANMLTFGHKIRNLLILASTEFEAQCVGILEANETAPIGRHFNTNDYIKLCEPLKLSQYQISLLRYPEVPILQPFEHWNTNNPTSSISWYDAYNKTKHDRETNFDKAKLSMAINAVGACAILYNPQLCSDNGLVSTYPYEVFGYARVPELEFSYLPPQNNEWTEIFYPF